MIDYIPSFKTLLQRTGVSVIYEDFKEKSEFPVITFEEAYNASYKEGDTLRYSDISFTVRVWTKSIAEMQRISCNIDEAMRGTGFKRTSTFEEKNNEIKIKIMRFEGTGFERI